MATIFKRSDRGGKHGKWYAEFTDEFGRRAKKCTGTRDKRAAEEIAAAWETESAKKRAGLADPNADRLKEQSQRPLTEHLTEFIASLKASKKSEEHWSQTENQVTAILTATGWRSFRDISAEGLESFLVKLGESKEGGKKSGRSARTLGSYVQSIGAFTRWAIRTHRISHNPLAHVQRPNPETDRRLERRMILPAEWPWLIKSIAEPRYSMSASDRQLLYLFAVQTGLRSSEIRSCQVANIDLDRKVVSVRARETKSTERAEQHITEGLATKLSRFVAGRPGSQALFSLCSESNMARMIRWDMENARKCWIESHVTDEAKEQCEQSDFLSVSNHRDEVIDFHSLRHTCGAWLAIQGVHPKTIQAIMRHSTITLTLDTYGHLMPGAEPEAIQKLENLCGL